jgi:hypothetical protein
LNKLCPATSRSIGVVAGEDMIEERLALLLKFLGTTMCSFGLILKVLVFEVDVVKGIVRKEG